MAIVNWLRSLPQRLAASRDAATVTAKVYRPRKPAPFCTHIATTMHWRISDDG